jgi:hypothetical protein
MGPLFCHLLLRSGQQQKRGFSAHACSLSWRRMHRRRRWCASQELVWPLLFVQAELSCVAAGSPAP